MIEGNACPDHIHMVLSIPPRISVAGAIGFLKAKSAIRLHYEFGRIEETCSRKASGVEGYLVFYVGLDRDVIIKYVQDQWKKDKFNDCQLDLQWS